MLNKLLLWKQQTCKEVKLMATVGDEFWGSRTQ